MLAHFSGVFFWLFVLEVPLPTTFHATSQVHPAFHGTGPKTPRAATTELHPWPSAGAEEVLRGAGWLEAEGPSSEEEGFLGMPSISLE